MMNEPGTFPPPATVRAEILAQHAELRATLRQTSALAQRVANNDVGALEALAAACAELRTMLDHHMSFEEEVLVPLLSAADTQGPERAQRFLDEHARQRAEIAVLASVRKDDPDYRAAAFATQTLMSDLLVDMDFEERIFAPEILGNAPTQSNQTVS
jgi:iron-sulfur cluster repair protein YtfE (RIC family)